MDFDVFMGFFLYLCPAVGIYRCTHRTKNPYKSIFGIWQFIAVTLFSK
jgi:hypothetical protein